MCGVSLLVEFDCLHVCVGKSSESGSVDGRLIRVRLHRIRRRLLH